MVLHKNLPQIKPHDPFLFVSTCVGGTLPQSGKRQSVFLTVALLLMKPKGKIIVNLLLTLRIGHIGQIASFPVVKL